MEVELGNGSEIQAKGIACDEEVRGRRNITILAQHVTQMEQANAEGCPAMLGIPLWPELLGEASARMDTAFHCQIDEEREFLACGEQ
jgi:hypothetical protein